MTTIKLTTNEFIEKALKVHGDKFDYSSTIYINSRTKINIICKEHGSFIQKPHSHLEGNGCKLCYKKSKTLTNEEFIQKSQLIHSNKYDYSLTNYTGNRNTVNIICKNHGIFTQLGQAHLQGSGCIRCADENQSLGKDLFIKRAMEVHGNKYDYSLVEYKSGRNKVDIKCEKHGIFCQQADSHLQGTGCPICKESKGEKEIRNFLNKNKIQFISQKKFSDCLNTNPLPFDFYLPQHNICIEYNGIQHYMSKDFFGGILSFEKLKRNDKIKKSYCNKNNIKLIIIKYSDNVIDKLTFLCH